MNNKIQLATVFLILGIFSSQLADLVCWMWLDNMDCMWQSLCSAYDKLEYIIAHKIVSMLFYYIGFYGFTGSILYYLELRFLGGWFSKIFETFGNIFGWVLTTIISTIIMNYFSQALGIDWLFDYIYNFVN
jgi:hypothetical protein